MYKGDISKGVFIGFSVALLALVFSSALAAAETPKGNVIGFVYASDGTTPIEGASIRIKSVDSSKVYESAKTDRTGMFKIRDLESGFYVYGVVTPKGEFNADSLVGIKIHEAETAKMSISVNPYSSKEATVQWAEIYREQQASGEALIGRILSFSPNTRLGEVSVLKGSLALHDKIHAKGEKTNFYQKVGVLKEGTAPASRVYAGHTAQMELKNTAQTGDRVYLVSKKSVLPLFLAPLGVATIVAWSGAIIKHNDVDDHGQDVSAFKK